MHIETSDQAFILMAMHRKVRFALSRRGCLLLRQLLKERLHPGTYRRIEVLGPDAFGQPRTSEYLLEWVVRSNNSEDDPLRFQLALERADRFGSCHVDVDNSFRIDQQPLDRGLGCIDQLLHFRQEVIRRHRCA